MSDKKLFAVTGNPVLHSKSPHIFNAAFKKMEINAIYFRLAAANPIEASWLFKNIGLSGMNVTAPFKESFMPLLDNVDENALHVGGVNTIVKEGDELKGYNTDYLGVVNALKDRQINIKGKKCLVIGAGGAGKAAAYGLSKEGGDVTIVNRTYEKAQQVGRKYNCEVQPIEELRKIMKIAAIVISTVSSEDKIVDPKWLRRKQVIFNANYKSDSFEKEAAEQGCIYLKGEEWLLHQAIPAFKLFLGQDPDTEAMKEGLKTAVPKTSLHELSIIGFALTKKNLEGKKLDKPEIYFGEKAESYPELADLFINTQNKTFDQLKQKVNEEISKAFTDIG